MADSNDDDGLPSEVVAWIDRRTRAFSPKRPGRTAAHYRAKLVLDAKLRYLDVIHFCEGITEDEGWAIVVKTLGKSYKEFTVQTSYWNRMATLRIAQERDLAKQVAATSQQTSEKLVEAIKTVTETTQASMQQWMEQMFDRFERLAITAATPQGAITHDNTGNGDRPNGEYHEHS